MRTRARVIVIALGAVIAAASASRADAQTGWGVAALKSGDIFFCDTNRDRVWKLDAAGHLVIAMDDTHCRAIVPGADGTVYGEFVGSAIPSQAELGVWRMTSTLQRAWLVPPSLEPDVATWLIWDRDHNGYAWNGAAAGGNISQVLRRDAGGTVAILAGGAWGGRDGRGGDARLGEVAGLALAPDGSIVFADSGNVRRIDANGNVHTEAMGVVSGQPGGSPERAGLWDHTTGIASDLDGSAVIVDDGARHIIRVGRDGRAVELWRPTGIVNSLSRGRWGWHPTGVAMMGSTCYVLETWPMPQLLADIVGNPRLLQVRADGSVTTVASISSALVRAAAALIVVALLSWVWNTYRPRASSALPLPPDAPRG